MIPRGPEYYALTPENRQILGTVPERWGRMDNMSRATLVEAGRCLREAGLLQDKDADRPRSGRIGLIAGSRRGSLAADLAYARSLTAGLDGASPALFSYTLPNIALAEAAIHYRLTGPVFAILSEHPFAEAVAAARQWLTCCDGQLDCIVAGEADVLPGGMEPAITVHFTDGSGPVTLYL